MRFALPWVCFLGTMGCEGSPATRAAEPSTEEQTGTEITESLTCDPVGEAQDELTAKGVACRAMCAAAAAAGCAVVGAACLTSSTVTVGGFTIPCAFALVVACTASSASGSVFIDLCPP